MHLVPKDSKIKYWSSLITRPFMRSKFGVALTLMKMEKFEKAMYEFHLLSEHLNQDDNQVKTKKNLVEKEKNF